MENRVNGFIYRTVKSQNGINETNVNNLTGIDSYEIRIDFNSWGPVLTNTDTQINTVSIGIIKPPFQNIPHNDERPGSIPGVFLRDHRNTLSNFEIFSQDYYDRLNLNFEVLHQITDFTGEFVAAGALDPNKIYDYNSFVQFTSFITLRERDVFVVWSRIYGTTLKLSIGYYFQRNYYEPPGFRN